MDQQLGLLIPWISRPRSTASRCVPNTFVAFGLPEALTAHPFFAGITCWLRFLVISCTSTTSDHRADCIVIERAYPAKAPSRSSEDLPRSTLVPIGDFTVREGFSNRRKRRESESLLLTFGEARCQETPHLYQVGSVEASSVPAREPTRLWRTLADTAWQVKHPSGEPYTSPRPAARQAINSPYRPGRVTFTTRPSCFSLERETLSDRLGSVLLDWNS